MNTHTPPSKKASFKKWYKETAVWAKEFDLYIYELNQLKEHISSKRVEDHIDIQVQKDIVLITRTTQDRLLKDLLDRLNKHRMQLAQILLSENQMEFQRHKEVHDALAKKIMKLREKLGSLKTRISNFLNSESRIQRHGFSY